MLLKYAFGASIAAPVVVLMLGCTEPAEPSFDGTITSIAVVKDVFQGTETMSLKVGQPGGEGNPCRQANVRITTSTAIYSKGYPDILLGPESLKVGYDVQVTPIPASDECPLDITATKIAIVGVVVITKSGTGG